MNLIKNLTLASVLFSAFTLIGCGADNTQDNAKNTNTNNTPAQTLKVVKVGVVGENNEDWKYVKEQVKKDGIDLELVKFADYTLPNRALNEGEIDLNAFQHVAYFNTEVSQKGFKLIRFADTYISPLGIYSKKIKNVNELADGATIAIPNDVTNGGRALKVLEQAGLIKLDASKGYAASVRDIQENSKNLKFYEVDAGNTPSLLPDVDAAIINSNYCQDNGINPLTDAIFSDVVGNNVASDNPYINIIAVREADKDNETYKVIAKAYQTKEVADILLKTYKGANQPVFKY